MSKETKNKEDAFGDWIVMIQKSWTWERLTIQEQKRFSVELSKFAKYDLKGTYKQRWNVLGGIYSIFLAALDYQPIGWREPENEKDNPRF